jgi:hypothetical protein
MCLNIRKPYIQSFMYFSFHQKLCTQKKKSKLIHKRKRFWHQDQNSARQQGTWTFFGDIDIYSRFVLFKILSTVDVHDYFLQDIGIFFIKNFRRITFEMCNDQLFPSFLRCKKCVCVYNYRRTNRKKKSILPGNLSKKPISSLIACTYGIYHIILRIKLSTYVLGILWYWININI